MTTFVVVADSVHTGATLCDYLSDRLADGDSVHAVDLHAPAPSPERRRDGADALNAIAVRLGALATVDSDQRAAEPSVAAALRSIVTDVDADELVVASASVGEPTSDVDDADTADVDDTLTGLLSSPPCPTVVVPASA